MGYVDKAEKLWVKTIQLNPRFMDAYSELMDLYLQTNQLEKASEYVRRLKEQGAAIPARWLNL